MNEMEKQRIINSILQGTASAEELKQFQSWVMDLGDDMLLNQYFEQGLQLDNDHFDKWKNDVLLGPTLKKMENIPEPDKQQIRSFHRIHFLRTAWFRVAVMIVLFSSIGAYLWLRNPKPELETATQPVPVQKDVMPGGNKAILTLADGSTITLDSASGGTIAQQSGANIQKSTNGEIIYAFDGATVSTSVVYNTMSTPRGGQYQLVLPDGSRVWLNAESSITFPTAFTGNTREIKMTGEAYFEIKPNATKPFIVKTISDEIQVLGTSFNINAYNDAPVKTSLLQGKIKVNAAMLKPGQAIINGNIISTNMEQDLAWKNGRFDFTDVDVRQAMLQIGRWYNVDIEFSGDIEKIKLSGALKRSIPLSNLLKGLEGIEGLHFTTKGNKIIVSRKTT